MGLIHCSSRPTTQPPPRAHTTPAHAHTTPAHLRTRTTHPPTRRRAPPTRAHHPTTHPPNPHTHLQGTAATAVAGLYGAMAVGGKPPSALADQSFVVLGAGSAGMGVVRMIAQGERVCVVCVCVWWRVGGGHGVASCRLPPTRTSSPPAHPPTHPPTHLPTPPSHTQPPMHACRDDQARAVSRAGCLSIPYPRPQVGGWRGWVDGWWVGGCVGTPTSLSPPQHSVWSQGAYHPPAGGA